MTPTRTASPATVVRTDDGVTLTFERSYDLPRDTVWRALTDPAQLAEWLDRADVDLRVGGEFVVHFDDGEMRGRITELESSRTLAYSWHEGQLGESHVRWELKDQPDGGTTVHLTHVRLRTESATGFAAGWHHHLERLDGVLLDCSREWNAERFQELMSMYGKART
jgi:uncharacterized protein YndB with AHSA1/START domain